MTQAAGLIAMPDGTPGVALLSFPALAPLKTDSFAIELLSILLVLIDVHLFKNKKLIAFYVSW